MYSARRELLCRTVCFIKRLSKAKPPFDILRFDIRHSAVCCSGHLKFHTRGSGFGFAVNPEPLNLEPLNGYALSIFLIPYLIMSTTGTDLVSENLIYCGIALIGFERLRRSLDARYWLLDTGCWILDTGYSILVAGLWSLATGHWMLDARYWLLASGIRQKA